MGDSFKTCDLHGKTFPNNMVDTRKTEMVKVYVERKEEIEGRTITLTLFVDKTAENEGIDVCAPDMQEKILNLLSASGSTPAWKAVNWNKETMQKKDGSGTYEKNVKTVLTVEEITEKIRAEKKAIPAK